MKAALFLSVVLIGSKRVGSMGYDIERFVGYVNEGLLCSICRDVLEDPLQAPCEHAFCTACIHGWLVHHSNCPEDRQAIDVSVLRPLYRYTMISLYVKIVWILEFSTLVVCCHPFSGNWWPAWKHFVFIITNFGGGKVSKWKERFCSPPFYILSADNRRVPGYYPEYLLQCSAKTFPYLFRESGQCSSWEQTEQCISDVFLFSPTISSLFCSSCYHRYCQLHQ